MVCVEQIARDWPGKSRPSEHPALWHMLDVGAVAQQLLSRRPVWSLQVDAALTCLVALHDLGKISRSFQAMLREDRRQKQYHWEHSGALLAQHQHVLSRHLGGDPDVLRILTEAVSGHHGGPRVPPDLRDQMTQQQEIGEAAQAIVPQVIALIAGLFPDASLTGLGVSDANRLSWMLNGLTIQSDWIGSDTDWFPPAAPDLTLSEYWDRAQDQAARAVRAAGLGQADLSARDPGAVLPDQAAPHPMQRAVLECALPDGPMLAVIEDATGAGKTEAALMLGARMMQAGKARGLFFGLPTMATANAMLPRLDQAAPVLFDTPPSLALSHGRAQLSAAFREIRARGRANAEPGPHCGPWLTDGRRRALLADLGVGTLDQALLGVLPTRFSGLRVWALADRVLIVDEAHSYDPYMQAQLERLLQMQARLGGSAIVLTATLPDTKKRAFQAAFRAGLDCAPRRAARRAGNRAAFQAGRRVDARSGVASKVYPALTTVAQAETVMAVEPASATVRDVAVMRLGSLSQAVDKIAQAAARGAACLWVRNAVDDAIQAVELLAEAGIAADLLHARFALCDRLRKETELIARFGKNGQGRAGRVLVTTQVCESSIDIDLDMMVSDLAPIGALIQRAGRLWRHMSVRPACNRPVPGPCLHVISPEPTQEQGPRWLHPVQDRGAYIYDPTVTWRSARALFDAGKIAAPSGLRPLIEAVEGDDPLPLPTGLQDQEFRSEGEGVIERQMALNSLVSTNEAFDQDLMHQVWDEEKFPTRLGVPQITLVLARRGDQGLIPWAGDDGGDPLSELWALSEVQMALLQTLPQVALTPRTETFMLRAVSPARPLFQP